MKKSYNFSISRRKFLQSSLKASALLSASAYIPQFLKGTPTIGRKQTTHGRTLVVIQLSGGNDGLNTVVPYRHDAYYEARPSLAIKSSDVISLTDELGFHPNLKGLAELYDQGELAVLNNVGYPNPNRSHFRSMDIWQTGSGSNEYKTTGWIGRWLDAKCQQVGDKPLLAVEIDDILSLAMKGEEAKGLAIKDPEAFYKHTHDPFFHAIAKQAVTKADEHPQVAYLHKTLAASTQSAEYVYEQSKLTPSKAAYPWTDIAAKLKTIAELIISESDTQVYYVSMSGFDTHVSQKWMHGNLLKKYANALNAFVKDLKEHDKLDDTLILTFSEFGRRVAQNASKGTDHGTANNVFVVGGQLGKAGILNEGPNLLDLDEGDLKFNLDFRRIYATILDKWLGVSSSSVLEGTFEPLTFIS